MSSLHQLLARIAGVPPHLGKVLDFGCGVGRLSLAWSRRADHVTGVDISASMIERGRSILKAAANVDLVLNETSDLRCFDDGAFDVVTSLICLQHMPWSIGSGYVREFGRVCRSGGLVAFQLPSRQLNPSRSSAWRKFIVDNLPFGLGKMWRKARHGSGAVFEMFFTAPALVLEAARSGGLTEIHREADSNAGTDCESFTYIFRKPR